MTLRYNFIYDKLVDNEDDIYGIIAYSVYKRHKINYIRDFKDRHEDADPTDQDMIPFNEISNSPIQLEFYRSEASELTREFLETVLSADLEEREAYFSNRVHEEISRIKPRHALDVFKGALGSLLFVLIVGLLYFAVWSLSVSPMKIIEEIFDVKIVSNQDPAKAPHNVDILDSSSVKDGTHSSKIEHN